MGLTLKDFYVPNKPYITKKLERDTLIKLLDSSSFVVDGIYKIANQCGGDIEIFNESVIDTFKVNGYVHSQIEGKYFDLDRIPLTVEWLINFGYTKREGSFCNQWWNGLNDVTHDWLVDITEMIDDGSFFYRNGKHVIKYVHELQNLHYMLSGEMLSLS